MKYIIYTILFLTGLNCTAQADTCFTESQIHAISKTLDSLYYIDSINNEIIATHKTIIFQLEQINYLDSLQLSYRTQQIAILEENIAIYVKREKLLEQKWYQHPAIWFTGGIAATLFTGKMIVAIIQ
jgi:hypothetical protein